jgi:hypothetical protein
MEVGDHRDAQTVEPLRPALEGYVDAAQLEPRGLEERPRAGGYYTGAE